MQKIIVTLGLAAAFFLVPVAAQAQIIDDFQVGIGVSGLGGANFIDEPADEDKIVTSDGRQFLVPYPGFAGSSTGFGFHLDLRYLDIIGLEIGTFFTTDEGSGEINDRNLTIGQKATHVPVLLKIAVPGIIVRPNAFVGFDFVFPGESIAEGEAGFALTSSAKSYTAFMFGFGFEVALPIPEVDIRIPLSFRGGLNTGFPENFEDRATFNTRGNVITGIDVLSEWLWEVQGTLGVVYYLPLDAF